MLTFSLCDALYNDLFTEFKDSEEFTRLKSLDLDEYTIYSDDLPVIYTDLGILSAEIEIHDNNEYYHSPVYQYRLHVTTKFLSEVAPFTTFTHSNILVIVDDYDETVSKPLYVNSYLQYQFNIDRSNLKFADYLYTLSFEKDLVQLIKVGVKNLSVLKLGIPMYNKSENEDLFRLSSVELDKWYKEACDNLSSDNNSSYVNQIMVYTSIFYICLIDKHELTKTCIYQLYYTPMLERFLDGLYEFLSKYKFKSIEMLVLHINIAESEVNRELIKRLKSVCKVVFV
jgi:hypothetical protein